MENVYITEYLLKKRREQARKNNKRTRWFEKTK